jgi:hypothetical protein
MLRLLSSKFRLLRPLFTPTPRANQRDAHHQQDQTNRTDKPLKDAETG